MIYICAEFYTRTPTNPPTQQPTHTHTHTYTHLHTYPPTHPPTHTVLLPSTIEGVAFNTAPVRRHTGVTDLKSVAFAIILHQYHIVSHKPCIC